MKLSHPFALFILLALVHAAFCMWMGSPLEVETAVGTESWSLHSSAFWGAALLLFQSIGYYVVRDRPLNLGLTMTHIASCIASLVIYWFFCAAQAGWVESDLTVVDAIAAGTGLHALGVVCYLLNMSIQLLATLLK